jgi:hypothetical protein
MDTLHGIGYMVVTVFKKGFFMPGEIGNEEESQQVGYYEHRYPQTGKFEDDPTYVPDENDPKKKQLQKDRIIKNMRNKCFKRDLIPPPEHSGLPGGGPDETSTGRKL